MPLAERPRVTETYLHPEIAAEFPNHDDLIREKMVNLGFLAQDSPVPYLRLLDSHPNSAARYIVDSEFVDTEGKVHRVLVSFLTDGTTSTHKHPHKPEYPEDVYEVYFPLTGSVVLHHGREDSRSGKVDEWNITKIPQEGWVVNPGIVHYAEAENGKPALTLIVMINAGNYPPDKQHIPRLFFIDFDK